MGGTNTFIALFPHTYIVSVEVLKGIFYVWERKVQCVRVRKAWKETYLSLQNNDITIRKQAIETYSTIRIEHERNENNIVETSTSRITFYEYKKKSQLKTEI